MCVAFGAYQMSEEYPLVLLVNRDEYYERPTFFLAQWSDDENIFGPRDVVHGGSWFGVSRQFKFALLTNYRDPTLRRQGACSRGLLIKQYLQSKVSTPDFAQELRQSQHLYNGYNLIFGTPDEVHYFSNISSDHVILDSGIFGLSNAYLNTPWPKVVDGRAEFAAVLHSHHANPILGANEFFKMMLKNETASDGRLPNSGVGYQLEQFLSPVFIKSETYGTRSTLLVVFKKNGGVSIVEREFGRLGVFEGERKISIERS